MGEQNGGTESAATDGGAVDGSSGFTPPATQADLDRIISDRLARERAKFGDYDDLKAKAAKFDQAEEATKSEIQKAIDKQAEAEARASMAESELTRYKAIAKHGIPEEYQHLVVGSDEATLERSAASVKELLGKSMDPPKARTDGPRVPGEGKPSPKALNSDALEDALRSKLGIA